MVTRPTTRPVSDDSSIEAKVPEPEAPEAENPPPEAPPDEIRIGPSCFYVPGSMLAFPLTWLGVLLTFFRFSPAFRLWLWNAVGFVSGQRALIDLYRWMKGTPIPVWLALLVVGLLYGVIRYVSSSYVVNYRVGEFMVSTGWFAFRSPGGLFRSYHDSILLPLIADVNHSVNPLQLLFGTGTLKVTFCELDANKRHDKEFRTIYLPFIPHAKKAAELLKLQSSVHGARFIT